MIRELTVAGDKHLYVRMVSSVSFNNAVVRRRFRLFLH